MKLRDNQQTKDRHRDDQNKVCHSFRHDCDCRRAVMRPTSSPDHFSGRTSRKQQDGPVLSDEKRLTCKLISTIQLKILKIWCFKHPVN